MSLMRSSFQMGSHKSKTMLRFTKVRPIYQPIMSEPHWRFKSLMDPKFWQSIQSTIWLISQAAINRVSSANRHPMRHQTEAIGAGTWRFCHRTNSKIRWLSPLKGTSSKLSFLKGLMRILLTRTRTPKTLLGFKIWAQLQTWSLLKTSREMR